MSDIKVQVSKRTSSKMEIPDLADAMNCAERLLERLKRLTDKVNVAGIKPSNDFVGNLAGKFAGRLYSESRYCYKTIWIGVQSEDCAGNVEVDFWVNKPSENQLVTDYKDNLLEAELDYKAEYDANDKGYWFRVDTGISLKTETDISKAKSEIERIIKKVLEQKVE